MKKREYTDLVGITLSPGDIKTCEDKGHKIKKYDLSFIPQKDGYYDESVDFIFLRQALEHSPYPIFSLMEYNRILKQGSYIYIEVPAPECDRMHEYNLNHYSILGQHQLTALLQRTGFKILNFEAIEFSVGIPTVTNEDGSIKELKEKYYCVVAVKDRPLDIK
jgi:SAM-dependent methyltransferase